VSFLALPHSIEDCDNGLVSVCASFDVLHNLSTHVHVQRVDQVQLDRQQRVPALFGELLFDLFDDCLVHHATLLLVLTNFRPSQLAGDFLGSSAPAILLATWVRNDTAICD
jgi:hypothetical protein